MIPTAKNKYNYTLSKELLELLENVIPYTEPDTSSFTWSSDDINVYCGTWDRSDSNVLTIYLNLVNLCVPEKIIFNGTTTICIFPDGSKIISRPTERDKFDKEVGVAMCIMKRLYGSRSEFQRKVKKAHDQNITNFE